MEDESTQQKAAIERAKIRQPCPKCGKEMSVLGLGTHVRFCGTKKAPKTQCPHCKAKVRWLQHHIKRSHTGPEQPPEDTSRPKYNTKVWTITMVNGSRQVASTVPEYVAQKILRMLI